MARRRFVKELLRQPWRLAAVSVASVAALVGLAAAPSASQADVATTVAASSPVVPSPPARAPSPGDRVAYDGLAERAAAEVCPGLPPPVLSAIAEVESSLGRVTGRSSAGARGPMQFLPATWAAYARDGNADGTADVNHPVDAVYTAARYLCANGGADPRRLRGAIWNYNRSSTYVRRVLALAGVTAA